jgi:hypothetical protein
MNPLIMLRIAIICYGDGLTVSAASVSISHAATDSYPFEMEIM